MMHKRIVCRSDNTDIENADHERQHNTSLQKHKDVSSLRVLFLKGADESKQLVPASI